MPKITRIMQQQRARDRYSVFVDGVYVFSLSEQALLRSGLAPGVELTDAEVKRNIQEADDDKLYARVLNYIAIRARSIGEVKQYMDRLEIAPALALKILNKLSEMQLVDDEAYVRAFVHDQMLHRPASKLKLQHKLRAKHIDNHLIEKVLGEHVMGDRDALRSIIAKKQQLPKYKNDRQKLTQYLLRQGFHYDDVRSILEEGD